MKKKFRAKGDFRRFLASVLFGHRYILFVETDANDKAWHIGRLVKQEYLKGITPSMGKGSVSEAEVQEVWRAVIWHGSEKHTYNLELGREVKVVPGRSYTFFEWMPYAPLGYLRPCELFNQYVVHRMKAQTEK